MWWRFIIFCFLVSFILFVVLNYLHDRPVVHFRFFKRGDDDQVVFERFKDNFLKERLVAFEFEPDNGTFVPEDVDIDEIMELMRNKINVHDPNTRQIAETFQDSPSVTENNVIDDLSSKNKFEKDFKEFDTIISDKEYKIDLEDSEIDVSKQTDIGTSEDDILLTDNKNRDDKNYSNSTLEEKVTENITETTKTENSPDVTNNFNANQIKTEMQEILSSDSKNEVNNDSLENAETTS